MLTELIVSSVRRRLSHKALGFRPNRRLRTKILDIDQIKSDPYNHVNSASVSPDLDCSRLA